MPSFEKCPRAIAVDLDGTLFNSQTEISLRTRRVLERCLARGLPVIIATSRPERSVWRRFEPALYERCSLILSNGAIARGVIPLSGGVDVAIADDMAREVVKVLLENEPEIQMTVEIRGFEFGMNRRPDAQTLWLVNSATPEMLLTVEQAIGVGARKISAGGLQRDLSGLAAILNQKFATDIEVIPGNDRTFLNIVKSGVSKSGALKALLDSRNIPLKEVMAFGDDNPDLDMLAACGYSVAMANATAEIKAASLYETLSNDEDGVAVVLEKVLATRVEGL